MELRAFAEQVLFAQTLEMKLWCPDSITDEHPGSPVSAPPMPGRPKELHFKSQSSSKSEFPGLHQLEDEKARGRLLHFFANHELLATELMALVLLRFPDAPAAFRRGVCQTLKDEQEHTRWYSERMRACGIHFGDLPVSGYFWRAISGMENPMDYVAGLSLTFEQANLDYCRHFARGFHAVGDTETSGLLDRIYKDEIAHVAYGLKWFRRWKKPDESDWEAFCQQLKYPLSPSRAKGISLNVEGRRAAGLEARFIDELNVFGQSKGRTPDVFYFNPFAEGRISQGNRFNPVKPQAAMVRDLANLPQFLCRKEDVVLLERRPGAPFLAGLKEATFDLPEFVELKQGRIDPQSSFATRKLNHLRPWAWGPDSLELFEPLRGNVGGESIGCFTPALAKLYSKAWSADFLRAVLADRKGDVHWLCPPEDVGGAAYSLEEALERVAKIRAEGHHRIVIKESYGLAGNNAIRLWEPEVLENQRRWIASAVADGRSVVVEPWLERVADLSIQLHVTDGGARICGYTGLINDQRGQFLANWASPNHERRLASRLAAHFSGHGDVPGRLHGLFEEIVERLGAAMRPLGFVGACGVDAFIYRAADGQVRLKPVVEINPRYTMGRLTVELMKRTCPGSWGQFALLQGTTLKRAGFAGFPEFAAHCRQRYPVQLGGMPAAKIRSGMVILNDPNQAEMWLAIFQVSRSFQELGTELSQNPGITN